MAGVGVSEPTSDHECTACHEYDHGLGGCDTCKAEARAAVLRSLREQLVDLYGDVDCIGPALQLLDRRLEAE